MQRDRKSEIHVQLTIQGTRNCAQRILYNPNRTNDTTMTLEEEPISDLLFTDEEDIKDIIEDLSENDC